ncbi:MAG: hypothetical protein F6J97_15230 [Leptolyngbya sp. SIO4C1]|nr:hypothetical protein [Leptolyngbya sp. SIO4C1]
MAYMFELIGIFPTLSFFQQQQRLEQTPKRSKALVSSYDCTLDSFIASTDLIYQKPDWDWDAVVNTMVSFWLSQGDNIYRWRRELAKADREQRLVAQVTNLRVFKCELETLFDA